MASSPKRPRTTLSGAVIIELTQQRSGQCSPVSPAAQRNADEEDAEEESRRLWRLCPSTENEPNVFGKLAGNNDSVHVELCGWTGYTPLRFFNLHNTTKLGCMINSQGKVCDPASAMMRRCTTLRELHDMINSSNPRLSVDVPVCVHVVAKRKIDVFAKNNRVMIIATLVVADSSGYCVLGTFNEGMATIYNPVEIGDMLLISRCQIQNTFRVYHKGLYSDNSFLDMEVKLAFHSVRSHFHGKFNPLELSRFKYPDNLFDADCKVKLPIMLEKELEPGASVPITLSTHSHYDLVGMICYVGRIERFKGILDSNQFDCLVEGSYTLQTVTRYILFRWVYLIDEQSRPIPVKVYVNNTCLHAQDCLVPGAIVAFTHCQTHEPEYSAKYVETSPFSQIYIREGIEKYYMLHPGRLRQQAASMLLRDNIIRMLSRTDIMWSVGGSHTNKILVPQTFRNFYDKKKYLNTFYEIPEGNPMLRRESRRICFKGTIMRIMEVLNEDKPEPIYFHEKYKHLVNVKRTEYKVLENFQSFHFFDNSSWFSFVRQLPVINPIVFQEKRGSAMTKRVVAEYKPYCLPLLIPPELNIDGTSGVPRLAALEKVDGPPYLLIDIVNEETKNWYTCIWKSFDYSHPERLNKVQTAYNKTIYGVIEVFCVEQNPINLEVNLHDFIVASD